MGQERCWILKFRASLKMSALGECEVIMRTNCNIFIFKQIMNINLSLFLSSAGIKQKWVPMDIEHKSGRHRRSHSAGRSPRQGPNNADKNDRNRQDRGRFGMLDGL